MYNAEVVWFINFITNNSLCCFSSCQNFWSGLWHVTRRDLDRMVAYGYINFSMLVQMF